MNLKNLLLAATAAALPSAALPSAAFAQPVVGPYVSLGAGVDFLQNEVTSSPSPFYGVPSANYRFSPGYAGEVSAGYGLGNGLRLEIEGDYSNNHVRNVGFSSPVRSGGFVQQYGGFVNGIYDFDLGLPVSPYLGAGVGYQEVELDGVNFGPANVVVPSRTRSNGNFAYQGIAGVAYPLDGILPGLALTAEYRFIGVVPQNYNQSYFDGSGALIGRQRVQFSDTFNHEILLGARYALYTPPPPPPPMAPPPVVAPTPARTYLVFFDWDRADLTGRARQIIAEAAQASTRVQTTRIEVNGYTDLSGTSQYNQGLSVRRAKAVQGELIRDGVPAGEIGIHGYGESNPLVQTAKGVREPQNRRVEIILK